MLMETYKWEEYQGEKKSKVISSIEESNIMQHLTHFYHDRNPTNLPWLLTDQESDIVKEVI